MKQLLCVVNLLKYEKHLKFLTDPLPPGKAGEPGLYYDKDAPKLPLLKKMAHLLKKH